MKSRLQKVATALVMLSLLYLIPTAWFGFYYNWKYAREHGFVNRLMFGKFVSTGKAFAWPYFMLTEWHSSQAIEDGDRHYLQAKTANDEAAKIVNRYDHLVDMKPEDAKTAARLYQLAASEATLVNSEYLAEVHPDFTAEYRNQYIPCAKQIADGLDSGNIATWLEGAAHCRQFERWMQDHREGLHFPP